MWKWDELKRTKVFIWDEATMSDGRVFRCVDLLLKQVKICYRSSSKIEDSELPFGGKTMLCGGDWKQLLPVVRGVFGSSLTDYTLKKDNDLWPHFQALLTIPASCFRFSN